MTHTIRRTFWVTGLLITGLWWWADATDWATVANWLGWRSLFMQYSGVMAMVAMTMAMVLAARPVVLEPWLGGLDKMYRLHKWLGIAALVVSVVHWLGAQGPKWLIGWGLLTRPARGPRPPPPDAVLAQFFQGQRGLAEGVGEWAFYGAVVLIALALFKRFPYRYFFKTHRLLAVAYLALVWHSAVLMQWAYWFTPLGVLMALGMAAGTAAALRVLTRRVAVQRQVVGEVEALRPYEAAGVLAMDIRLRGRWPGHESGQFAFLTLHEDEGPHPYTMASAWVDDGRITFVIKGLGDYTRTLPDRVRVGDVVKVEGPYGRFNFQGTCPRQIWVGAGIGVTPFIARMQALAKAPDGRAVDLFHPTSALDEAALARMQEDADAAGVRLHVLLSQRDGRLNAQRLTEAVPQWREAEVWFCGPAAFGRQLRQDLEAMGLPPGRFHQELFEMR
ncbi:ferric reductase-like transmembrane domain-containing protein [Hydrogenophaga sp.]|uniref:ferredoxin reductase family protein n=1 Tax=Hydrogenophaga sp. TaxID=1904254 RepID=UPI0035AD974B